MRHFFIFILSALLLPFFAEASCVQDPYVLTELLNDPLGSRINQAPNRSIFIVKVDSLSVAYHGGSLSHATVLKTFRGDVKIGENIIISTGANTTAGGAILIIGQQYIVFSRRSPENIFSAFTCDNFSAVISSNAHPEPSCDYEQGDHILALVTKYFQLQKEHYTGRVAFRMDGILLGKGRFKNGKPHGRWKHYYPCDAKEKCLKSKMHYKNGIVCGKEIIFRRNEKQPFKITSYKKGRAVFIKYFDDHLNLSMTTKIKYLANNQSQHEITSFYPDGKIKERKTIFHTGFKASNFHINRYNTGLYESYYPNKQIKEKGYFYRGAKIKDWKYFTTNGSLKEAINYPIPDTTIAQFIIFHESGQPKTTGQFKEGKKVGKWQAYYSNGHIRLIQFFKNDLRDGPCQSFRRDKTMMSECLYKKGKKDGIEKTFQKDGKRIAKTVLYRNGKKEGLEEQYFPDGTLQHTATFRNNTFHGKRIRYTQGGQILLLENYKKGFKDGNFEKYYQDGTLQTKGQFQQGLKVGSWTKYHKNGQLASKCKYPKPQPGTFYNMPTSCEAYDKDGTPLE